MVGFVVGILCLVERPMVDLRVTDPAASVVQVFTCLSSNGFMRRAHRHFIIGVLIMKYGISIVLTNAAVCKGYLRHNCQNGELLSTDSYATMIRLIAKLGDADYWSSTSVMTLNFESLLSFQLGRARSISYAFVSSSTKQAYRLIRLKTLKTYQSKPSGRVAPLRERFVNREEL